MAWNWEQPDWPNFLWNAARFTRAEEAFALRSGVLIGTIAHLPSQDQEQLAIEILSGEAVTTSEIEGEVLHRASVQSSIRRALGLTTGAQRVTPAEEGVGELMVDLFRGYAEPLDEPTLLRWQGMIVRGRTDLRDVGRYRTHSEPMQVVSGAIYEPTVHFEAPPSDRVDSEMRRYIDWFNDSSPQGTKPLSALTRTGISHLYFETIHPFEDGNGRVGRALAEKALAQSVGRPTLTAISATILLRRAAYYNALAAANRQNEITEWLAWFAGIALESQRRTQAQVEFLIDKARLMSTLQDRLNARQNAALLRMFREGPEGFRGGMSAAKYSAITKASSATTTRDLADLVDAGALTRTGERKHTRYQLAIPLRPVPRVTIDDDGRISEHHPQR